MAKIDSLEKNDISPVDTPESKTLRELEKRKDGSMLNAFGKILDGFIVESWLTPEKSKWAEGLKRQYMGNASAILNDPTLNAAWKDSALQKLFGTFKENKEFFPTPTEQLQSWESAQMKYEKSKDDFYEKFLKSLERVDAEREQKLQKNSRKISQNPEWMAGQDYPPATQLANAELNDKFATV